MAPGDITHLDISLLTCNDFIVHFSSQYTYCRKVMPLWGSLLVLPGTLRTIAGITPGKLASREKL